MSKTIPAEKLLPTERDVNPRRVIQYMEWYCEGKKVDNIQTTRYNGNCIIGDGHHKACALYLLERPIVASVLWWNWENFTQWKGAIGKHFSLKKFRRDYEGVYRPDLEDRGIITLPDLVDKTDLKNRIFDGSKIRRFFEVPPPSGSHYRGLL